MSRLPPLTAWDGAVLLTIVVLLVTAVGPGVLAPWLRYAAGLTAFAVWMAWFVVFSVRVLTDWGPEPSGAAAEATGESGAGPNDKR